MADKDAVVHIGENSPEGVAYKLYKDIIQREEEIPDRQFILDLYAECIEAVHRERSVRRRQA